MLDEKSEKPDPASVQEQLAVLDRLLALPFSEDEPLDDDHAPGPNHHLYVLRASRDFWEDPDEDAVLAAEEEIADAHRTLADAVTARWGVPEAVDLWPFVEPALSETAPIPEPVGELCQLSGGMLVWRRPDTGRWAALAIGQADAEFPIELLAAVGELTALDEALSAVQAENRTER